MPANWTLGALKPMHCAKCNRETEHLAVSYVKTFGGTQYSWKCTRCDKEKKIN